jgi:hypothetical protein
LEAEGWEPESNVCAGCGHPGGDHDLNNWCLTCPRPDHAGHGFTAKIDAGWDYFSSFSRRDLWDHAVARLVAVGVTVEEHP